MTGDEFLELRRWMADRWPSLAHLTDGQWLAYREELDRFQTVNVWSAVRACFSAGDEYPPAVGKLARLTADWERQQQQKALPAGRGMSWEEYSRERWGEVVPLCRAYERLVGE